MPPDVDLPRLQSLLWPTLVAVKELGGSGSIAEIEAKVVELIDATEAQQAVLHKQGPLSQINYMVAWCRTYLKFAGYLVNTVRGVWSLTETGRLATEADMIAVRLQYREASRTRLLTSFRWLDGPAVRHRRRSPQIQRCGADLVGTSVLVDDERDGSIRERPPHGRHRSP
jgi:restriction endonuclease Mrr